MPLQALIERTRNNAAGLTASKSAPCLSPEAAAYHYCNKDAKFEAVEAMKRRQIALAAPRVLSQQRLFHDNIVLIEPSVDASDREVYTRNGFKCAATNLVGLAQDGGMPPWLS